MYVTPGEAYFEARLTAAFGQGPGRLHLVRPDRPVHVELVARDLHGSTDDGPPAWAGEGHPWPDERTAGQESRDGGTAPHPSVLQLREVGRKRSSADATLIEAVVGVVDAVRVRLLEDKGLVGVDLARGQARALDAEVRRAAVAEVEVTLGFGVTEAQAVVGVATAAGDLRAVVLAALRRGEATWPMVRVFWESSCRLSQTQRLLVAVALFGQDPALACEERLGCEGQLVSCPWADGSYRQACQREISACEGADVTAERERRRRAYARRRASIRVHDDGTATLSVTGPAVTLAAVHQRIDRVARLIRGAGDERSLDNLRCDTIESLLLYGTVEPPEVLAEPPDVLGEPPDVLAEPPEVLAGEGVDELVCPEGLEQMARVINAQPLVRMQVVVPHAVLGSTLAVCASCAGTIAPGAPPGGPLPPSGSRPGHSNQASPTSPPPPSSSHDPTAFAPGQHRGQVAEVLGPNPFFVTPGHARELALLPGTTLHRLVVDPLDGRLVERSTGSYRPDADMRRQVVAADVYSRAPGTRTGSHACELDHVVPYGWAGGQTSEVNLAMLGKRPHRLKTLQVWRVAIGERRDLTFTTLLGQIARTRSHDYRQYSHVRDAEDLEDLEDRRDRASRAVYAALAARPEHRFRPRAGGWLSLTHRDDHGGVRPGPPSRAETLDDVVGRDTDTR